MTNKISIIKTSIVALAAAALMAACSAASTIPDLHIDGLKTVDFGQTKQEVVSSLGSYELIPAADLRGDSVFSCDGLVVSYDAVKFSPKFVFSQKGKLKEVNGTIINSDPTLITNLQGYLASKFGHAEVKDNWQTYSDGGVIVVLSSTGSSTGAFNFIEFRSPDIHN